MLKAAFIGLWMTLCGSFAMSAAIIGMPVSSIVYEVVRANIMLGAVISAFYLTFAAMHEWRTGGDTIARMRALNRKPIHPPRTIVDPATIVHEQRVFKSPEEIELMQRYLHEGSAPQR